MRALIVYAALLAAAALLINDARADDWRPIDTKREIAYQVLHVIDWGQTLSIVDDPQFREGNPFLGEDPTRAQVNTYFLATGALHYGVSRLLPPKGRDWWQWITIGVQATTVGNNYNVGLRMDF